MVGDGLVVVVDFGGEEEFAEVDEAACAGDDEVVVASYPTDACLLGPVAFEEGGSVDGDAEGSLGAADCFCQLSYLGLHGFVVVGAVGVEGELGLVGWDTMGGGVVEGEADDGAAAGEDALGMEAGIAVAVHVVHVGVIAVGYPAVEG